MSERNGSRVNVRDQTGARRPYAGVIVRLLAILMDVVVLSAVFFPVTRLARGTWLMTPGDHLWRAGWFVTDPLCLIFLGIMFAYFVLFEGLSGATPGKMLLGLEVVGVDGGRPGVARALLRNVLRAVDGLPALGILAAVLITKSEERARFGDMVAETRVLERRTRKGNGTAV